MAPTPLRHEIDIAVDPFHKRLASGISGRDFVGGARARVDLAAGLLDGRTAHPARHALSVWSVYGIFTLSLTR